MKRIALRSLMGLAPLITVLCFRSQSRAADKEFEVGDEVKVTIGPAPLTEGGAMLGAVKAGTVLQVLATQEGSVQVQVELDGKPRTGWLRTLYVKRNVVRPKPAGNAEVAETEQPGEASEAEKAEDPEIEAWQAHWRAFIAAVGKALKTVAKDLPERTGLGTVRNVWPRVSLGFDGSTVQWTGIVGRIAAAPDENTPGEILVFLDRLTIGGSGRDSIVADCLALQPDPDQREGWAAVKPGARICFRTRLCAKGEGPTSLPCVIAWTTTLEGLGGHWLDVQTAGAELVQMLGEGSPRPRRATSGRGGSCLRCSYPGRLEAVSNKVALSPDQGLSKEEQSRAIGLLTEHALMNEERRIVARMFFP